jgi:hypothetical protein
VGRAHREKSIGRLSVRLLIRRFPMLVLMARPAISWR